MFLSVSVVVSFGLINTKGKRDEVGGWGDHKHIEKVEERPHPQKFEFVLCTGFLRFVLRL